MELLSSKQQTQMNQMFCVQTSHPEKLMHINVTQNCLKKNCWRILERPVSVCQIRLRRCALRELLDNAEESKPHDVEMRSKKGLLFRLKGSSLGKDLNLFNLNELMLDVLRNFLR